MQAIDLSMGSTIWTYSDRSINGSGLVGTPEYYNGVLYEGTYLGDVIAVDASSGNLLWEYPTVSGGAPPIALSIEDSPLIADGKLFEGRSQLNEVWGQCLTENQLVAYELTQPSFLSTFTTTPAQSNSQGATVWSSPMLDPSGNLYIATANSCVQNSRSPHSPYGSKMSQTQPRQFESQVGGEKGHQMGPPTTILVLRLCMSTAWSSTVARTGSCMPTTRKQELTCGSTTRALAIPTSCKSIVGSIGTDGTYLYVPYDAATYNGNTVGAIIALDMMGHQVWRIITALDPEGFGTLSAPAMAQGMLFVGYEDYACATSRGINCFRMSAIDGATGRILWSFDGPNEIYGGPTIVDGYLLFSEFTDSGQNNHLYCYALPGLR